MHIDTQIKQETQETNEDPTYTGGAGIEEIMHKVKADHIYKLSSNENPLGPSPKAIAAIQATLADLNLYPARDDDTLRAALSTYHDNRASDDHFFTADSGCEILQLIARTYLEAGDEVILSQPTFPVYALTAKAQGATVINCPLQAGTFQLDIPAILAAVTERTKLVYVCNPSNPTGVMAPAADVSQLIAQLPAHVMVVADEVYHHFVTRSDFPDSIQAVLDGRNVIIVHSFSKAFGMAGMRLGYGIADPQVVQAIRAKRRPFHINKLAMAAGIAALADHDHINKTVAVTTAGKQYISAELTRLGVKHWPSETNFIVFESPIDSTIVNDRLIERGIMIRPTDGFGLPHHLRVTIGTEIANKAFVDALEWALKG